jgi:hypothetical protein
MMRTSMLPVNASSSYLKVRWNHLHCVEHVVKSFCAASIIWRIGGVFTLLPVHMHFYCIPHGHVGYRKHGLIHCNSDEIEMIVMFMRG